MQKSLLRVDFILFGFLLTFTSSFGQTFYISLFSKPIRDSLSLSNFEFSAVYSLATLFSAAVLLWTGPAIDAMRLERVTGISLLGLLFGVLAFAFSESHIFVLFIALFCLRQFGQGMLSQISAATMSRGFQAARGRALSLSTLGHSFGEAILPSIAVAGLLRYGLQLTWLLIACSLVLIASVILVFSRRVRQKQEMPEPTSSTQKSSANTRQWTRKEALHDIYFWMLLPMLNTVPFVLTALFFHQTSIAHGKHWSTTLFAASFSLFALTQIMGSLSAGWLIDRWSARQLLRFTLLPLLFACLILALSNAKLSIWAFMGLAGLCAGAMFPTVVAALAETYGVRNIGSIKSIVISAMVFSTAISPPLIGWFLDQNIHINTVAVYLFTGVLCTLLAGNLALTLINKRLSVHDLTG